MTEGRLERSRALIICACSDLQQCAYVGTGTLRTWTFNVVSSFRPVECFVPSAGRSPAYEQSAPGVRPSEDHETLQDHTVTRYSPT